MKYEIKNIDISKIKINENSRVEMREADYSDLMSSIKQHGLKQPIGVYVENGNFVTIWGNRRFLACKKLGLDKIEAKVYDEKLDNKDLMIVNLIENVQRKDITIPEMGRIINILKKEDLSLGEIAVRLSLSNSRVRSAYDVYNKLPDRYKKKVKFYDKQEGKGKGNISAATAITLTKMRRELRLIDSDFDKLVKYTIENSLSADDIRVVARFMDLGISLNKAMLKQKKYTIFRLNTPLLIAQKDDLMKKYQQPFAKILIQMLQGKIKERLRI